MIIKFDHLTFVTSQPNLQDTLDNFVKQGYNIKFKEERLANIEIKKKYLFFNQEFHDLYFLEASDSIAIEVISYSQTTTDNAPLQFNLRDKIIIHNAINQQALLDLYLTLGMKRVDADNIIMNGMLDRDPIIGNFTNVDTVSFNLDNEGFCCPTLIVDSYPKTKQLVEGKGYFCSEVNELIVNNKQLKIFFVEGKFGEVIEIISIK